MNSVTPDDQCIELELLQAIDRACLAFEESWTDGNRPELLDYLREFTDAPRRRALRELLWIEWDQLRRSETPPSLESYATRFAELSDVVEEAWQADLKRLATIGTTMEPRGGRYRIIKPHARGGLGQVYVARDEELGRQVAVKEIQPGKAHEPNTRERFLREARITGTLEHPGIVPVYSMGQNPDGTPYYAMRFIHGESLLAAIKKLFGSGGGHCDPIPRDVSLEGTQPTMQDATPAVEGNGVARSGDRPQQASSGWQLQDSGDRPQQRSGNRPQPNRVPASMYESRDFRQLLTRFIYVCNVIEFAHRHGVLHRDLKPSNIMLGEHGETLVVDWGLAKQIGADESATSGDASAAFAQNASEFTTHGVALGTPAYMSPEQAAGKLAELGPASDVYSLGATLFHLLVGRSPPESHSMVSTVQPAVPRALSAICAKAMAQSTEERYASATALADDLERWLAHEPVTAYAEPLRIRVARWSRRHATLVTTGIAATLLVMIGLATTTALMAFKNRQLADARTDAETKRITAESAQAKAEKRLTQVEKGADLLGGIFDELDPNAAEKDGRPLQAILGDKMLAAAKEIEGDTIGDPLLVAELQYTLGTSLIGLGHYDEAVAILTKSHQTCDRHLGSNHLDTLRALGSLASAFRLSGDVRKAIPLFEQCLSVRQQTFGEDHEGTLTSLSNLASAYDEAGNAERAIPMLEKCLTKRRALLGEDHANTLTTQNNLANSYQSSGRVAKAIPLLEQVLTKRRATLGEDHPKTLMSISNLANAYMEDSDLARAIPLLERCHEKSQTKLGKSHPNTLSSATVLAIAYRRNGEVGKALPMIEQCLNQSRANLGADHPDTIRRIDLLAVAYYSSGQVSKALSLFEEGLARTISKNGEEHPDSLELMNNLAVAYQLLGDSKKALPLFEQCLTFRKAKLGDDHPATIRTQDGLASAYQSTGDLAKAISLFEHCLERRRAVCGEDHPETLSSLNNLAVAYSSANEHAKALPLFEQCLRQAQNKLGEDHPDALNYLNNLAAIYQRQGEFDKAFSLYQRCLQGQQAKLGHDHPNTLNTLFGLAMAYMSTGKLEMAVPLFEQLLERRRSILGEEHVETQAAMQFLSEASCGVKEFSKAEALLQDCLERRQRAIPDDWRTFNTQSWLGTALSGQKRFDQAEPLLLQGYEGLAARQQKIPPSQQHRLNVAIQHLVELYADWGKPEEAAKWKARLTPDDKKE